MGALIKSANWSVSTPDQVLVKASICGDTSAFGALVQRHSDRLLRVAQQVTRNLDDAQEAVQEAFLNAYQKLHQFQGNSKFSTWLIRIVLNESLLILRKGRSWTTRKFPLEWSDPWGDNLSLQVSDRHPNPEQLYFQAELREMLRTGLSKLRPILRDVFVLRDIEELSISETAAILNVSSNVVKVRLHRARLELREWLTRYSDQPDSSATMYHTSGFQRGSKNHVPFLTAKSPFSVIDTTLSESWVFRVGLRSNRREGCRLKIVTETANTQADGCEFSHLV